MWCSKIRHSNIDCLEKIVLPAILYLIFVLADMVVAGEGNSLYMHNNGTYKEYGANREYTIEHDAESDYKVGNYGNNLIPSSLIKSPREGSSAILVEKDSQTLWVYTSKNGEFIKVFEIPCSTGEVDGPKMVEGDKKTPEGIYFMKKSHEDRFLAPIYGNRAFTTDYPNFLDITLGRTGSSIWIHGTNKRLKPMDSNGCVAMNNSDVIKLAPYVVLDETPLIIMDRVDYASMEASEAQRTDILDFISRWIESLNEGSYLEYLFHYSADYLPDVSWWAEWIDIRSRTAVSANPVKAKFNHVGIYKHKDHFVVLLDFQVSSGYRMISVGKRKLFISPHINKLSSSYYTGNSYKIIGDVFQTIITKRTGENNNHFITAAAKLDGQYKAMR